eukprot:gene11203-12492_t
MLEGKNTSSRFLEEFFVLGGCSSRANPHLEHAEGVNGFSSERDPVLVEIEYIPSKDSCCRRTIGQKRKKCSSHDDLEQEHHQGSTIRSSVNEGHMVVTSRYKKSRSMMPFYRLTFRSLSKKSTVGMKLDPLSFHMLGRTTSLSGASRASSAVMEIVHAAKMARLAEDGDRSECQTIRIITDMSSIITGLASLQVCPEFSTTLLLENTPFEMLPQGTEEALPLP